MSTMRSTTWRFLAMLLFASVVMTSVVLAHHGWTGYDENKTLTVNGVITEASYANPHATVRIQAAGDKKVCG